MERGRTPVLGINLGRSGSFADLTPAGFVERLATSPRGATRSIA